MKFICLFLLCYLIPFSGTPTFEWITGDEHDFGILRQNEPASFDFQFRNLSDEPITIDNVRTTCGCTKPVYSDAPILPDSVGIITVGYDAKKIGYFRKRIRVFISSQRKAENLYIEGEVE